jgi:sulfur-carrier protein adenylyltransferase/sulfurtransferase
MTDKTISTKPIPYSDKLMQVLSEVKSQISEISIDEVCALKNNNEDFYLIDVRDHDEYLAGNIENSIHISRGWLEFKIQNHVHNQADKIVLYCGSGGRSAFAAQRLNQLGFKDVYSMKGGINGWAQAGFDII